MWIALEALTRVVVGALLVAAAVFKLAATPQWRRTWVRSLVGLDQFGGVVVWWFAFVEAAAGAALLLGLGGLQVVTGAFIAIAVATVTVVAALLLGRRVPCGCFSAQALISWRIVARNLVLLGALTAVTAHIWADGWGAPAAVHAPWPVQVVIAAGSAGLVTAFVLARRLRPVIEVTDAEMETALAAHVPRPDDIPSSPSHSGGNPMATRRDILRKSGLLGLGGLALSFFPEAASASARTPGVGRMRLQLGDTIYECTSTGTSSPTEDNPENLKGTFSYSGTCVGGATILVHNARTTATKRCHTDPRGVATGTALLDFRLTPAGGTTQTFQDVHASYTGAVASDGLLTIVATAATDDGSLRYVNVWKATQSATTDCLNGTQLTTVSLSGNNTITA